MRDELEPLVGTYNWDQAFIQNPGLPVYEVSEEQRRKVHGVLIVQQHRRSDTGSFSSV